jgi:ubiquitin C-terminal hydrolase
MAETPNHDLSIDRQITVIADNFPIFSCFDCAVAIRNFLVKHKIPGKQILLSTGSTQKPFCNIYCDRLGQNISINGKHTAIAVSIDGQERIFDNIHPQGVSRVEWINSFYSPIQDLGQDFHIVETEF